VGSRRSGGDEPRGDTLLHRGTFWTACAQFGGEDIQVIVERHGKAALFLPFCLAFVPSYILCQLSTLSGNPFADEFNGVVLG
jgi:hypothetical protein